MVVSCRVRAKELKETCPWDQDCGRWIRVGPELHIVVSLCLQPDPFVRMQEEFEARVEIFLPSAVRK
ncbi:hypothetical protein HanRHA438_Chr09g0383831 [Helianthus annuus]|nr:hypothetical protein HanRHA438_Chr09g0383831 [Helianthus annuus]